MKVAFRDSFAKDLKSIRNKAVLSRIREIIEVIELSENLSRMPNLKKLKGRENYYRVRTGDYRIGIALKSDIVIFVRVLNRKDIYKYFP